MKTNVSTLLREFPRVRRAALSGEEVLIQTREGTLRLSAYNPPRASILGRCRDVIVHTDDDIDGPTTEPSEWESRE